MSRENNYFKQLKEYIIKNSIRYSFEKCVEEWDTTWYGTLNNFYSLDIENLDNEVLTEVRVDCICGKCNIYNLYEITNKYTKHKAIIGSECINRFNGTHTGNTFSGLKNMLRDPRIGPNKNIIDKELQLGVINESEAEFLRKMLYKKEHTLEENSKRFKLHDRILNARANIL